MATVDSSITEGSTPDSGSEVLVAVTGSRWSTSRSPASPGSEPTTGTVRPAATTAEATIEAVNARRTGASFRPESLVGTWPTFETLKRHC